MLCFRGFELYSRWVPLASDGSAVKSHSTIYITTAPPSNLTRLYYEGFAANLTRLLHVEVTILALHSDALGGSSRVFSPAVKRLNERLRDKPKKRL